MQACRGVGGGERSLWKVELEGAFESPPNRGRVPPRTGSAPCLHEGRSTKAHHPQACTRQGLRRVPPQRAAPPRAGRRLGGACQPLCSCGNTCPRARPILPQACNRQNLYCVPLYDSLGENAIEFIINHSETSAVFVQVGL